MKPICVACQRFYRAKKSGYYFIEGMPRNGARRPRAGKKYSEDWRPYKVWVGDLWRCEGCGHELVSGVAHQPLSENYKDDFHDVIERTGARRLQVNDC